MKRFLLLTAFAHLTVSGAAHSSEIGVIPPTESVGGYSQSDLSVLWWQWAWSFDRATSPVADKTGEHCGRRQPNGVWFLAGTYGTARVVRTCTVPAGRPIFFPLVNYIMYPRADASPSCMRLMSEAARATDAPLALVLEVDGTRIPVDESSRQAPRQCFDLGALVDPPVRIFPTAANGYYVALRPLPKGTYQLNFGAILPSLQQAVTYKLIIE